MIKVDKENKIITICDDKNSFFYNPENPGVVTVNMLHKALSKNGIEDVIIDDGTMRLDNYIMEIESTFSMSINITITNSIIKGPTTIWGEENDSETANF